MLNKIMQVTKGHLRRVFDCRALLEPSVYLENQIFFQFDRGRKTSGFIWMNLH
uniref:Uncharacterized protein n=1 Tax=Daphnia magna TaxID=35525 RepID=A0A0P6GPM3_9CRUS